MMTTRDNGDPSMTPDWTPTAKACELLDWRTDHVGAGVTTIPANVVLGAE